MDTKEFDRWCASAVSGIRYKPDRGKVYAELYAHLSDRCAAMTDAGVPEDEAVKQALAAMGSASEVAEQLEQIHRPFWGYMLRAARWLLLIAAVLGAVIIFPWLIEQHIVTPGDLEATQPVYAETSYETHVFIERPMTQDSSDGYRFTLTRIDGLCSKSVAAAGKTAAENVYLTVEVRNLRPWTWAQRTAILRDFYAVDSLGNRYEAYNDSWRDGVEPTMLTFAQRNTRIGTVSVILALKDYCSQGAEWIELRYDRAGRDVRLRGNLPGGDGT